MNQYENNCTPQILKQVDNEEQKMYNKQEQSGDFNNQRLQMTFKKNGDDLEELSHETGLYILDDSTKSKSSSIIGAAQKLDG